MQSMMLRMSLEAPRYGFQKGAESAIARAASAKEPFGHPNPTKNFTLLETALARARVRVSKHHIYCVGKLSIFWCHET